MNQLIAALTFFTRLPVWRIATADSRYYRSVVPFWPFAGWLTGATMCITLWAMSHIIPTFAAIVAALLSRILLTGALHEDGLADFCDGMGGGRTRDSILSIMKDSHIGTYGVIGLIFLFLLASSLLLAFPVSTACCIIFAGDAWSKACAAQIINILPYARTEEEAKNHTVYSRMTLLQFITCIAAGALPLIYLPVSLLGATLFPIMTAALMITLMKRQLNGYTGDCCGATFLICELTFYLGAAILYRLQS